MNTLYLSFLGVWILQQVVFADVIGLLFRFYLISSYYNHTNLRRKGIVFVMGQTVRPHMMMFSSTGGVVLKELDIGLKITETIMCR